MTPTLAPTGRDRLTGAGALLLITALVAGVPAALLAIGADPTRWDLPTGQEALA
ncbi:MAG: hypothetical protein IE926_16290, partial [Micrococcales bacterium]|nr:hypothetical protein [Micrococcales bacterium]